MFEHIGVGKEETCGVDTPNGPCTMPKGHQAKFHRHRVYPNTVYWIIKSIHLRPNILSRGNGRVPLNYAISDALKTHDRIVIELEVGTDD